MAGLSDDQLAEIQKNMFGTGTSGAAQAAPSAPAQPVVMPIGPLSDDQHAEIQRNLTHSDVPKLTTAQKNQPLINIGPEPKYGDDDSQSFINSFANTAGFSLPRNAAAGIRWGLGKVGAGDYPDMPFGQIYDGLKQRDDQIAHNHPFGDTAGTVAGVGATILAAPVADAAALTPSVLGADLRSSMIGGLPAYARSAVIGGGAAGLGTLSDTHDPSAALAAAATGGIAGAAADKIANVVKPFISKATTVAGPLTAREQQLLTPGNINTPGTPSYWMAQHGPELASRAIGAGAGYFTGEALGDHGMIGLAAGLAAPNGIDKVINHYNDARNASAADGKFYARGNRMSMAVGAAVPSLLHYMGDPEMSTSGQVISDNLHAAGRQFRGLLGGSSGDQ